MINYLILNSVKLDDIETISLGLSKTDQEDAQHENLWVLEINFDYFHQNRSGCFYYVHQC